MPGMGIQSFTCTFLLVIALHMVHLSFDAERVSTFPVTLPALTLSRCYIAMFKDCQ